MKLLLCRKCQDIVKFQIFTRQCLCGGCSGRYLEDGLHVEYSGEHAVVIGFNNNSLRAAIVDTYAEVSRMIEACIEEGGENGRQKFEAFRIPETSDRIKKVQRG